MLYCRKPKSNKQPTCDDDEDGDDEDECENTKYHVEM